MTNPVTIWDTNAAAVATRRTIIGRTEPEGDDPAEPIYSDPVPLERLREGRWRRPEWTPEHRANPHANGATCFEPGEVILDRKDRPDTMPEGKTLGPPRSVPLVDLEEGTAVWYTLVDETLAARKAEMLEQCRLRFRAVRDQGASIDLGAGPVGILTIPEAANDVDRLHNDLVLRQAGGEQNPTQDIATSEYVVVPGVTVATAAAMREAVATHWRATWACDAALGAAINDAADHAALDLIDVEAGTVDGVGGWPT